MLLFAVPCFAQDTNIENGQTPVGVIKAPDWASYMGNLQSKVKNNWHPPIIEKGKKVVCRFKVERDGNISNIRIARSEGEEHDNAAIEAIKKAAPFEPLPNEFAGRYLDIDFTFDYNVLNVPKKTSSMPEKVYKPDLPKKRDYSSEALSSYNKSSNISPKASYVIQARQKILKNWKPKEYFSYKKTKKANNILCKLTINKKGELVDYKIIESANYKKAEKRVIKAIEKSAPFESFPDEMNKDSVTFKIHFIY